MLLLTVGVAAIISTMPLFWALASDQYSGKVSAAAAIALINSLGLIGDFISPSVIGWLKTTTGSLDSGLYFIAVLMLVGALVLVNASHPRSSV